MPKTPAPPKPKPVQKCELCEQPTDTPIGCAQCAKLICPGCVAASEEPGAPEICEDCF